MFQLRFKKKPMISPAEEADIALYGPQADFHESQKLYALRGIRLSPSVSGVFETNSNAVKPPL
jgi:hypothetical protein